MDEEKEETNRVTDNFTKKPKYKQLSLQQKLEIINHVEEKGVQQAEIATQYGVSRTTVSRIVKNKDKYKLSSPKRRMLKSRTRSDDGKYKNMEEMLFQWMKQKRSLGISISGPILKEKAIFFNKKLHGSDSFKASDGWLSKFKIRYGIRQVSVQGERLSADDDGATEFKEEFTRVIEEGQYSLDNVYNADETGLIFKSLPTKTLLLGAEKEAAGHKQSKERVTIMNCANASGSHKVPLLLIGKSRRPRCFKNISESEFPLVYRAQSNAWMNSEIFIDWYRNVFIPSVKERKPGEDENLILLLDNAPCHPKAGILNEIDPQFKISYLPPNVTAVLQPMDQGVIECMKKHYKASFLKKLILFDCNSPDAIIHFLKKWNLLDTMSTVSNAWLMVPLSALSKAWKKLLGETVLPAIPDDKVPKMAAVLDRFHGPGTFSNSDIEEWVKDDVTTPTCREISDRAFIEKFSGNHTASSDAETDSDVERDENGNELCSDNEDSIDSTLQETTLEDEKHFIEMHKNFIKFQTWFQKRADCTSEDRLRLCYMQSALEETLLDKILEKN